MKCLWLIPERDKKDGSLEESAQAQLKIYRLPETNWARKLHAKLSFQGKENDQQRNELADVQQARLYRRT
jgi:hypothetical protein